jgi:hypothetical protein
MHTKKASSWPECNSCANASIIIRILKFRCVTLNREKILDCPDRDATCGDRAVPCGAREALIGVARPPPSRSLAASA